MSINRPEQFEKLRACGMIVGKALRAMAVQVREGVTTAELCKIGSRVLAEHGARSSPPMVYGFPGDVCISVNDEVVHGIPGDHNIQRGDLVKLDLTAEKDGYHPDSAVSVEVTPGKGNARELARCAERAFRQALEAARAGNLHRLKPVLFSALLRREPGDQVWFDENPLPDIVAGVMVFGVA